MLVKLAIFPIAALNYPSIHHIGVFIKSIFVLCVKKVKFDANIRNSTNSICRFAKIKVVKSGIPIEGFPVRKQGLIKQRINERIFS